MTEPSSPPPVKRWTVIGLTTYNSDRLLVAAVIEGQHWASDVMTTHGYCRTVLHVDATNVVQAEKHAQLGYDHNGQMPAPTRAEDVEPGDVLVSIHYGSGADHASTMVVEEVAATGRNGDGDVVLDLVEQDEPEIHDPSERMWVVKTP